MYFRNLCLLVWTLSWLGIAECSWNYRPQSWKSTELQKRSINTRLMARSPPDDEGSVFGLLDFIKTLQLLGTILSAEVEDPDSEREGIEGSGDDSLIQGLMQLATEGSGAIQDLADSMAEGSGAGGVFGGLLDDIPEGSGDNGPFQGLIALAESLQDLSLILQGDDDDGQQTDGDGETGEVPDPKAPCTSPYVEIAYRMCILPELDQRLSWDDASSYCKSKGLELAMDSVVIKSRRYFNDELGETGSRVRWPIWVGGKRHDDESGGGEQRWLWGDGTSIPDFLWSSGQPRTYSIDTAPNGICMILDGYEKYFGGSLPCHFRRRFVCQRPH